MTTIRAFIKRHPVLSYFVLAFAISWGGILPIIGGVGAIPGTTEETTELFPAVYLVTVAGPSLAGLLLTGLTGGWTAFRELGSRLLKWRVGARWYAVALLTTPLTVMATLLSLSLISPEFLPGFLTHECQGVLAAVRLRGKCGSIDRPLGGTRMDRVRHTQAPGAPRRPRYRALRGAPVGRVALPLEYLGKRYLLRGPPRPLHARDPLLLPAPLQGADGAGLRAYREPAGGDAHARESRSVLDNLRSCGDGRGAARDVVPRMGCRAVGRRWSGRHGPRRTSLATATATGTGGLRKE